MYDQICMCTLVRSLGQESEERDFKPWRRFKYPNNLHLHWTGESKLWFLHLSIERRKNFSILPHPHPPPHDHIFPTLLSVFCLQARTPSPKVFRSENSNILLSVSNKKNSYSNTEYDRLVSSLSLCSAGAWFWVLLPTANDRASNTWRLSQPSHTIVEILS